MTNNHIYLSYEDRQKIINALINKRNDLINAGHYTNAIDEMLEKIIRNKFMRVKVKEVSS